MKRYWFTFLLLLVGGLLQAKEPIVINLWPDGAPNDNKMRAQTEGGELYVAEPTLTIFPAERGNGLAIVACPGGGYWGLAMEHEGTMMADWMNRMGITYAVLRYRMPNGNNEVPLSDAQQALRIMRQHAAEWNIQKLGIMGSSAPGQHRRDPFHRRRDPARFPDPFLSGHHDGPGVHPHGLARQPAGQVARQGPGDQILQ